MTIEHQQSERRGTFFVAGSDGRAAEMTYQRPNPKTMVIDHTEVSGALQGKNVGLQLVQQAVEYARTEGLKIVPVCSFARAMFEKKTEFRDVLQSEPGEEI